MSPSIEAVWRLEATRLIGALLRAGAHVALPEDCAHDALVAAMHRWPSEGWPDRPGAWLMTAAKLPVEQPSVLPVLVLLPGATSTLALAEAVGTVFHGFSIS